MASEGERTMQESMQEVWADMRACERVENMLRGKQEVKPAVQRRLPRGRGNGRGGKRAGRGSSTAAAASELSVEDLTAGAVAACKEERKRRRLLEVAEEHSDETLSELARFTDGMRLDLYEPFLHYVPRLVNVVTLAEAFPMAGSGIKLPLNLAHIAARCSSAYYAPRRFAAVQLAYATPRCRVLIFHTGRLVGTGCQGGMAARLAIAKAQRQLAVEADVHLHVRNFQIINQVAAASLRATLNCDAFAAAHTASAHFDKKSFVGLAWRPAGESICCEVYSTGRANLPGSVAERQVLDSFSRMLPELLRFSSSAHVLEKIPEERQARHRVDCSAPNDRNVAQGVLVESGRDEPISVNEMRKRVAKRRGVMGRSVRVEEEETPEPVAEVQEEETNGFAGWGDWGGGESSGLGGGLMQALESNTDGVDLGALGF